MSYFVLRYDSVVDDYVNRRTPFRPAHLQLVRDGYERGEIVMAGAVGDPPDGAILVFASDTPETAERFVKSDPYVQNGLILKWRVQPWTVVAGGRS
jgi:uncharacterized protein YciI